MKTKILATALTLLLISGSAFASLKWSSNKSSVSHFSENKKFELQFINQKMIFKKENQILWEKALKTVPGIVRLSNDGQAIVIVNLGWADEGGFESVSFYDGQGNERKELMFGPGEKNLNLKWINSSYLSSDGKYFILCDSTASILFYSVEESKLLWEKAISSKEQKYSPWDARVSQSGDFILTCSYNSDNAEALFVFLNKDGKTLLEKRIAKGFPLTTKKRLFGLVTYVYLNEQEQKLIEMDTQGKQFSVYSLPESKWIKFENNGMNVVEVL